MRPFSPSTQNTLLLEMYLKPVDGAAVHEGGELSEAGAEGITDRAHSQHHVKLVPHSVDEQVEQGQGCTVSLLGFLPRPLEEGRSCVRRA